MIKSQRQLDFEASTDYWIWESECGIGKKEAWPEYRKIKFLKEGCAFCEYFKCSKCFLNKKLGDCRDSESIYRKWIYSETIKERMKYAKIIADFHIKFCKKEFGG